ncbi:MAG: hypothetical protein JXQ87_15555 [Bacteroidia bacterium]
MNFFKKTFLPILLATLWISASEFIRNSILLHRQWINHYEKLGLTFPEEPINGAVWGIWSLCYAITIFIISRKFTSTQTIIFSWFVGFVLMWLVVGNMSVLPFGILYFAIPLSILEAAVATIIIVKLSKEKAV